jgi:hypothetical protein
MAEAAPQRTFAVLVDGDNAPGDVLKRVLLEVEKHGEARVRLVFGSTSSLQGHSEDANAYGFRPILQFKVASRKNAADIALAIAAIDLLHGGVVNAFCIVSSDSDFHPLATRLREEGRFVLGIGRDNTPDALKSACHRFVSFEILDKSSDAPVAAKSGKTKAPAQPVREPLKDLPHLRDILAQAFQTAQGDDGWASLAAVGSQLRIMEPGFDPRKYGRRQLWMLVQETNLYEFRPEPPAGPNETLYIHPKT